MAAPTNTVTSVNNVGIREDLENTISRVAPEETPFTSNIGKKTATNTYHEWQTENLATPDPTNAQLEGDDVASLDAPNLTARLGNYCQIFRKTGGVARTQEIVDKAGRDSEMARQKALKGLEMKRDMEARFAGNYASNAQSGSTPRRSAGILAFITTNDVRGTGGADGGFSAGVVAAATNGTQRTFTEAMVKTAMANAFAAGGKPKIAMLGATLKQTFSSFTGIAQMRTETGNKLGTIVGGADVYISDFGPLTLVPHPYAFSRDCLLLDPDMAAVATLDGVKSRALAVTGDNERFLMTAEKCLVVQNERAHAVIADLS